MRRHATHEGRPVTLDLLETLAPLPTGGTPGDDPRSLEGREWWHGKFFPNDCKAGTNSRSWEKGGPETVRLARHLPTDAEIGRTVRLHGERARAVLEPWRAMWEEATATLGGIEDYARASRAHLGYNATFVSDKERIAREAMVDGRTQNSAANLVNALRFKGRPDDDDTVRDRALHTLEDATSQLALAAAGVPFGVMVPRPGDRKDWFAWTPGAGLRPIVDEDKRSKVGSWLQSAERAADPYWRFEAFRSRAGRPMATTASFCHLRAVLLDMAAQGHHKAFLKSAESKRGTWVVDLSGPLDVRSLHDRIASAMGELVMDLSGSGNRATILVQGLTPFVREHRFLVVGHRVVTSTASCRTLSPLDALPDRILHPATARLLAPAETAGPYDRGASDAEADRGLVARMAWAARDLARAIDKESSSDGSPVEGMPDCYCIDIGQTDDGRILPIEINGMSFVGTYAADYARVAAAYARQVEASRTAPDGECDLPTPIAPDDVLGAGTRAALVEGYVEARLRGEDIDKVRQFSAYRTKRIEETLRSEGLPPLEVARQTAVFSPWERDAWMPEWLEYLAKEAEGVIASTLDGFHRAPGADGHVLVHRWGFDGTPRWHPRREYVSERAAAKGPFARVTAHAPRSGIDWAGTVGAHLALGSTDEVRFLPGSRLRIVEATVCQPDGSWSAAGVESLIGLEMVPDDA